MIAWHLCGHLDFVSIQVLTTGYGRAPPAIAETTNNHDIHRQRKDDRLPLLDGRVSHEAASASLATALISCYGACIVALLRVRNIVRPARFRFLSVQYQPVTGKYLYRI